jgi:pyridoxamine 5'-phosphate oxidase
MSSVRPRTAGGFDVEWRRGFAARAPHPAGTQGFRWRKSGMQHHATSLIVLVHDAPRTAIMNPPAFSRPALNIADQRRDYARAELTETDVDSDPLLQFERWLAEAIKAALPEPTAMTLATADVAGRPSARIVLLKGVNADGFAFFTNYQSRKGGELDARNEAALLFHWIELERQVRIEGAVGKLPPAESDAYFASRPLPARVGAWASPQSRVIPDRAWLEREFEASKLRFAGGDGDIPRPPHWGGYRVMPTSMEFWQGRPSRLHDRIRYSRANGTWRIERLAP